MIFRLENSSVIFNGHETDAHTIVVRERSDVRRGGPRALIASAIIDGGTRMKEKASERGLAVGKLRVYERSNLRAMKRLRLQLTTDSS
jgi:hypothetical protein